MKKIFVLVVFIALGIGSFINSGCNQQDVNNAINVVVNDVSGAVGGAQIVVTTIGPPATPAQAACAAAWGVIFGISASARTDGTWPGKFNDTINLARLHSRYYDASNPYEQMGIAHNEILNNYFKLRPESNYRPGALLNNEDGATFISDYLLDPNSTLRPDCGTNVNFTINVANRPNMSNTIKGLIEGGMQVRVKDFTSPEDFENYLPSLNLRGNVKTAADVFKAIVYQNYSNTLSNIDALTTNCVQEVNKIKNNYYSLTESEKVYVFSWISVLKYSAIYWNHFRVSSKSS